MDKVEIVKLTSHDLDAFIDLVKVFEDVFEMQNFVMPSREHLQKLLSKPDFFVFVALKDREVVGGLTTYTLHQYYATTPLLYIYDLAVKTDFQRQGIGKKLIATVLSFGKSIGMEEVFVQADKVDDYALDFYRSTGAIEEDVSHFYYPLLKNN
ncbi:MAG: GNAT family N-acetyltransferase [Cyclobacteriaceae bacterium]